VIRAFIDAYNLRWEPFRWTKTPDQVLPTNRKRNSATRANPWSQIDAQLRPVLTEYLRHYNAVRPHRSLDLQPPGSVSRLRLVEPVTSRSVERVDVLGGLIHEYRRAA
jgi:transposase InsO family protein